MAALRQVTAAALLFLIPCSAEETNSPAQYLKPRDFNPHPYDTSDQLLSKFYKHLNRPVPTKQGPILFPNDAPPPPKPPLIVTSRPLAESISRSELNPTPAPLNNSLAQPSYLSGIRIGRPNFAPLNFYKKLATYTNDNPESDYGVTYNKPETNYGHAGPPTYGLIYNKPETNGATNYGLTNNKPITNYVRTGVEYDGLTGTRNYGLVDPKSALDSNLNALNYKTPESDNDFTYKKPDSVYDSIRKPQLNYGPINFYKKPLLAVDNDLGGNSDGEDYGNGDEGNVEYVHPYASLVKKSRLLGNSADHRYDDYEERTVLPPIYKALSDYARQKVLNTPAKPTPPAPTQAKPHQKSGSHDDYQDYSNDVADSEYGKKYAFSYSVRDHKTGDDFSHSQSSSGAATNGEYRVRLPDGRMQIVSYTADEGGYKADVRYAEDDPVETKPNTVQHPRNGIDYRPNAVQHPQNGIDYQPNAVQHPQNGIDYRPNAVQHPQNGIGYKQKQSDSADYYDDAVEQSNAGIYAPIRAQEGKFKPIVVSEYSFDKVTDTSNNYKATTPYDNTILITPTKRPFYYQQFTTERPFYLAQSTPKYLYNSIPVEINVPSTTPVPDFSRPSYSTTERVVRIGSTKSPLLYTSIRNRLSHGSTGAPISYKSSSDSGYFASSTPNSFSPESHRSNFVSRFSKYLNFD